MTTTGFHNLTVQCSHAIGMPDARIVVIDHPLGGIEEDAVRTRAATIVEQVLQHWTK